MQDDVLGAVSLIFWTLTLVVLIKYVGIVMMANDDGEGGSVRWSCCRTYECMARVWGNVWRSCVVWRGVAWCGGVGWGGNRGMTLALVCSRPRQLLHSLAGGTFALYSLLCRKIGIKPHSTLNSGESQQMRALTSLSRTSSFLRGGTAGGTAGCGSSGDRPWWQFLSIRSSSVRRAMRRSRASQYMLW